MKQTHKIGHYQVSGNESGREGVDFIITISNGKPYQLFFQFIDFGIERSIKILNKI